MKFLSKILLMFFVISVVKRTSCIVYTKKLCNFKLFCPPRKKVRFSLSCFGIGIFYNVYIFFIIGSRWRLINWHNLGFFPLWSVSQVIFIKEWVAYSYNDSTKKNLFTFIQCLKLFSKQIKLQTRKDTQHFHYDQCLNHFKIESNGENFFNCNYCPK